MHAPSSAASPDTPPVVPCQPRPRTPGTTAYRIRTTDGTLVATHHRSDTAHGKRFWWTRADGSNGLDRPATELPLYRSETLRDAPPGAFIVVVEGERAADALAARNLRAVATVTGSSTIPSDAVLESLRHYDAILWPDADAPGRQHMQRIAARLHALGIPVQLFDPWPDRTDGVDAADVGDDIDTYILLALIVLAPPWTPPGPACNDPTPDDATARATTPPRAHAPSGRQSAAHRLVAALGERIYPFRDTITRQLYIDIWTTTTTRITMPLDHGEGEATTTILSLLHHELGEDLPSTSITREMIHRIRASVRPTDHQCVSVRTAHHAGAVYIDLAEPDSSAAIAITGNGWDIVRVPPVRFVRRRTMEPLPRPDRQGSLAPLRAILAVDDDAWIVVIAWLLAALAPDGPYPILAIEGPPGASKSTTARILRAMIDPSAAPLIAEPRDGVDLMLAAAAARIVAIDNLPSTLPGPMVDALCRLATDGAIITRQLYSDAEITVHRGARPIILTSVGSVLSRGDFADRALPLILGPMPDDRRLAESELRIAIAACRPVVLAALAEAIAHGLRTAPLPPAPRPVRMIDACLWAARCAPGLGIDPEAIVAAFATAREAAMTAAADAEPVAAAIMAFMATRDSWVGTAVQLLEALSTAGLLPPGRRLPADGRALRRRLRMLEPALAMQGIAVIDRRITRERRLELRRTQD